MGCCGSSPREGSRGGKPGASGRGGGNGGTGKQGGGSRKSHELQTYDPVRYLSDPARIRDPNRHVIRVHFIAQKVLENGGNHWVILLQTAPNEAIHINMEPGNLVGAPSPGHGYRGEMQITHRDYGITTNQHTVVTLPATPGLTSAHFIDAIISAGNHEYDFVTEGRGCTGWILDQFHLFRQLGFIPQELDFLNTGINMEWVDGKPRRQWPATRGFYMKETRDGGWSRSRGGRSGVGTSRGTSRR